MSDRKLTINDKVWKYRIGKQNAVIHYPDGTKKITVSLSKITGISDNDIERGRRKKTSDGMIKPSDIKQYILNYCRIQK